MRPNNVGWFLVIFFLAGGIFFWIAIPDIWIGQIWFVVALGLAALYVFMGRRADAADKLKREGIPAQGQILEMTQTGMYVNEQPQVKLRLRISGAGLTSFEAEKKLVVPLIALGNLGIGKPLAVFVDKTDQSNFTIDWSGAAAPPTTEQPGTGTAHAGAAATPTTPPGPADQATPVEEREPGEPIERMRKLNELREAKLVTEEEFAAQRQRILDDV